MVRTSNGRSNERSAQRADRARRRILEAAGRAFRRRGYARAGMRDIAAEADLSPANLYHYFRGKDEILFYCQDRSLDAMLGSLRRARRSAVPAAERVRQVLMAHLTTILDDLEGSAAHLETDALPPALARRIARKRDQYERGIRRIVGEGIRRGELSPADAGIVTRAMLGALNWTARWYDPSGPRPAGILAAEIAAYLVRGLTAAPPAAPAGARRRRAAPGGRA